MGTSLGVSSDRWTAWDLTRRISPRDQVRVMVREADGQLHINQYPRLFRVGPDAPTTPWCIRLADAAHQFRLLCFDFDAKTPDAVENAVDDCDALSAVLDELSIVHVVCQSSAGGGRHVWIGIAGGASPAIVAAVAREAHATYDTLDHGMLLNPAEGAARPPGAPHRDGSTSTVLRGHVDALAALTTTPGELERLAVVLGERKPALRHVDTRPSGPVDGLHHTHRALSKTGEGHMATIDGGSNPSWTGFMCLLTAASAGWTLGDALHAAKTAPGMEHFRTKNTGRGTRRPRSAGEAHDRLSRQWAKAQQYAALQRPLPAAQEPRDLTELYAIVTDVDDLLMRLRVNAGRWGRTEAAISQRTILIALAYLTLQTGKHTVAASIRDLALMAGLGRTTAASALHALTKAGFIQQVRSADGGNAAEWELIGKFSTAPDTVRSQPFNNPRPPPELFTLRAALVRTIENQLTDQLHDLFTRQGLGHLAGRIYTLLREHASLTIDSAARLLGVSSRYTATILSRLRRHRLIIKDSEGWARSCRDLRTMAARVLGVEGMLEARRERYGAERVVWAWWQAEYATMTSTPRQRSRRPHVSSRPLFEAGTSGERIWPRYPRSPDGRADHHQAREFVDEGVLNPENRWQLSVA
ncbi:hypothetical protein E3O10_07435 [Cryobacterium luteum]|uniref:Uncharacterized protein n=2 Tax=Cryobacterium luteum TaxID=1424661 RepID=A0A5F0D6B2_9MICO|nr:hypothetical protein E3O10_07435 [Cryobacterium luteum]